MLFVRGMRAQLLARQLLGSLQATLLDRRRDF
jgi:hypothetical protein